MTRRTLGELQAVALVFGFIFLVAVVLQLMGVT